jgi:hypothetical protein
MSSKIKPLLNVKALPKDPKEMLNLEVSVLKGCSEEIAGALAEKGIKTISDLIKVENVEDFLPQKGGSGSRSLDHGKVLYRRPNH